MTPAFTPLALSAAVEAFASYYYPERLGPADARRRSDDQPRPARLRSAGFLLPEKDQQMLQETITSDQPAAELAGLCRPAMLGGVHRRGPCGVGPAVRAAGRAARHAGGVAVPRRHRPAAAVASGRARSRRAQRDPGAAHRLADGGGARAGAGRHLLRHAAASACSRSAISSARASSSIISKRPTASTTCSATSRCSRTTISPR